MANRTRKVIYVGFTRDLIKRVWEHKNDVTKGFTRRYKVHDLIYYEIYGNPEDAIRREKQIKSSSRKRKNKLITTMNLKLKDLYEELLGD